jgi:anthranilate synthase component 2/putative glutamine amidotransferase
VTPPPRPLIGISSYLDEAAWGVWRQPAALLATTYVNAVTRAGGIAVVLPPQEHGAGRLIGALDGLVLSGGPDVNPEQYGQVPHPLTGPPNRERDAWEAALLDAALAQDVPVLGVCRGMQLLNVALGGELTQHLPDDLGDVNHQPARAVFGEQSVRIRPSSLLGGILGRTAPIRCYHHQAIRRLGAGLLPSAWHADETVEAVELPDRRFVVGVQWHPETVPDDLRLFKALVQAAHDTSTVSMRKAPDIA